MGGFHERFILGEDKELELVEKAQIKKVFVERKERMKEEAAHITDTDFDNTVNKHSLTLIDFWAEWCGPCRALAPTIEELARDLVGKVFVAKLNVDENPSTAERFQVFSIPTVLVMKNGKEADRIVGCVPKDQIETVLRKYM